MKGLLLFFLAVVATSACKALELVPVDAVPRSLMLLDFIESTAPPYAVEYLLDSFPNFSLKSLSRTKLITLLDKRF